MFGDWVLAAPGERPEFDFLEHSGDNDDESIRDDKEDAIFDFVNEDAMDCDGEEFDFVNPEAQQDEQDEEKEEQQEDWEEEDHPDTGPQLDPTTDTELPDYPSYDDPFEINTARSLFISGVQHSLANCTAALIDIFVCWSAFIHVLKHFSRLRSRNIKRADSSRLL